MDASRTVTSFTVGRLLARFMRVQLDTLALQAVTYREQKGVLDSVFTVYSSPTIARGLREWIHEHESARHVFMTRRAEVRRLRRLAQEHGIGSFTVKRCGTRGMREVTLSGTRFRIQAFQAEAE